MAVVIGNYICRYTLDENDIKVDEGEVFECGDRKYVQFNASKAPVKVPRTVDIGRVWKDGKTLWMPVRDDEEARKTFTEHCVSRMTELEKQIDILGETIDFIRDYKFKVGSKCFVYISDNAGAVAKKKSAKKKDAEQLRRYRNAYEAGDFVNPKQYIERKIEMLEKEMFIHVGDDEMRHLKTLETQNAIDAAVRSIIDRHWSM